MAVTLFGDMTDECKLRDHDFDQSYDKRFRGEVRNAKGTPSLHLIFGRIYCRRTAGMGLISRPLFSRALGEVRCRKSEGFLLKIWIDLPNGGGDEISSGRKSVCELFLMIIQQSLVRHDDQSFV